MSRTSTVRTEDVKIERQIKNSDPLDVLRTALSKGLAELNTPDFRVSHIRGTLTCNGRKFSVSIEESYKNRY